MKNIVNTAYGRFLSTHTLLGLPFSILENTTLNQKLKIQADQAPAPTELPTLKYYSIGNRGSKCATGPNGVAKTNYEQHRSTDGAPFNIIPFVIREPDMDLTAAEKAKYALRTSIVVKGKTYIAYYLKRFDLVGVKPTMLHYVVDNGVTTVSPFIPTLENLNPTPPDLSNTGVNTLNGEYISTTAKIELKFTPFDATELIHVAEVLYDDPTYAVINEFCLCTGVDRAVTYVGPSGNFNFNEAIGVQAFAHYASLKTIDTPSDEFTMTLDVGLTDPLFKIAP